MTLFQWIGFLVLGLLLAASIRSFQAGRMRLPGLLFWCALSAAGAAALLFPDSTTIIAHSIGVERGADLLLYSAILVGLLVVFIGYLRFRILDRQITLLVRKLALEIAAEPKSESASDSSTPKNPTTQQEHTPT